jgi:hypothetical protein
MTTDEYLNLITSEHRGKQKFEATVSTSVSPFAKIQDVLKSLPAAFDIDVAVGRQLDAVGAWVGRSRRIDTPLVGVYFEWDGTTSVGWESGVWKGPYDPDSGLVDLPDDSYRTLLKAKIAANNWDGTFPQAYAIWKSAFGTESALLIQDNQDMSMVIGIAWQPMDIIEQALLLNGYIPLKPAGVRVQYYAIAPAAGSLMAWDVTPNDALAGWDAGQWATELIPA